MRNVLLPRQKACGLLYHPFLKGNTAYRPIPFSRFIHVDGKNRLSTFWAPTGGITPKSAEEHDSHSLLVRAGYLRQAYSGIFHLLPLGLRVQDKIERLIDKHMRSLGASKISLSSISSQELWRRTGRLKAGTSELFQLKDRKDGAYLLSPTHEEEITALVADIVQSYKDVPLRLYQVSRKYRDERRPRQGLLRAREFVMKDLYTFDYSVEAALKTYDSVREAYSSFFDDLQIPYLVAEADSGNMGGDLSHEYHYVMPKGEDDVISCAKCDYVANEELARKIVAPPTLHEVPPPTRMWTGISHDRRTLVVAHWISPSAETRSTSTETDPSELNLHALKAVLPSLDSGVESPLELFHQTISNPVMEPDAAEPCIAHMFDGQIGHQRISDLVAINFQDVPNWKELHQAASKSGQSIMTKIIALSDTGEPMDLVRIRAGDCCPRCKSHSLRVSKAVELGHTFHLGTRYSKTLEAAVEIPTELRNSTDEIAGRRTLQMGCHGIGVSRLISAIASTMVDAKGLNWPRVIAPFEVVIVPRKGFEEDAAAIYETLANEPYGSVTDMIIDDRVHLDLGWRLTDADLIGYPVIVVLGTRWKKERKCEVQCRRLGNLREDVECEKLPQFVRSLLDKL